MGYTHYFNTSNLTTEDHAKIAKYAKSALNLFEADGPKVQWEDDVALPPTITPGIIRFNGISDAGHETFVLTYRLCGNGFEFCKTAQKPYDTLVVAILTIGKAVAGDRFMFRSDGYEDDLMDGIELAEQAMGTKIDRDVVFSDMLN